MSLLFHFGFKLNIKNNIINKKSTEITIFGFQLNPHRS